MLPCAPLQPLFLYRVIHDPPQAKENRETFLARIRAENQAMKRSSGIERLDSIDLEVLAIGDHYGMHLYRTMGLHVHCWVLYMYTYMMYMYSIYNMYTVHVVHVHVCT